MCDHDSVGTFLFVVVLLIIVGLLLLYVVATTIDSAGPVVGCSVLVVSLILAIWLVSLATGDGDGSSGSPSTSQAAGA